MPSKRKNFNTNNTKCSCNKNPQIKTSTHDKADDADLMLSSIEIYGDCEENFFDSEQDETEIILGTGATTHTIGNKNLFIELHPTNRNSNNLNSNPQVSKEGTIKIGALLIRNVAFVPGAQNVISFSKLNDEFGLTWEGGNDYFAFFKDGQMVCSATQKGSFFFINEVNLSPDEKELNKLKEFIIETHIGLGHASSVEVRNYIQKKSACKIPIGKIEEFIKACECKSGIGSSVMSKPVFNTPGERISLDLVGKIGAGYLFTARDSASRFLVCDMIETKAQVTETAISTLKFLQNHLDRNNLAVRSIRLSYEFKSKGLIRFCLDNGIQVGFTATNPSPKGESTARKPKKILEQIRGILQFGKVPPQYCTFAVRYVAFMHNFFAINEHGLCPWESFNKLKSTIPKNFKVPPFGCKIISSNGNRENCTGVFLGFSNRTKTAIVLLPNDQIIKTSSFTVFKNSFPFKNNVFY